MNPAEIGFPGGYRLCPLLPEDGPAILQLIDEIHEEYGFTLEPGERDQDLLDLARAYDGPAEGFWTLKDPAGSIAGTVALAKKEEDTIELCRLYLAPAHRGKGLGRDLMRFAVEQSRRFGYRRMWLETHTKMTEAVGLYEAFGFHRIPPYSGHPLSYTDYAAELVL